MRPWPILSVFFLAWLAASVPASSADRRKACTPARAVTATIAQVHGDFERWRGVCVRLTGLLAERRLYADRAALAEPLRPYEPAKPRSIVVYPEGPGRVLAPGMAEVVGRIGSCELHHAAAEAAQAEAPGSIVWASGYCHTSMETYISPTTIVRLSDARVPRLTEREIPPDSRPLVEAPETTPGLAMHVAAARALAAAIAGRDPSEFLRLNDPDIALDLAGLKGKPAPGWLRARLRENRKAFAAQAGRDGLLRRIAPVEGRQQRVLIDRDEVAESADDLPARVITCWCREPDCTGRWPVLEADADNTERRPYACVRTNPTLVHRKGMFMEADASRRPGPFAEP